MSEKRFTSFVEDDGYWIRDESDFKIIATGLKLGVAENLIAYLNELNDENKELKKENERLLHKLQKTKEYLQIKINECKNPKKMKEIVFGVEQARGYEKALLQFQKGLKRRLNDE